ncbi:MAG: DsbA family protein [Candidatus Diapherotrites archaeon]|uniref:DsbA family protein n=1 Tax=Candidatus Iainarchaeum sp. TaxID=3101447 RepID=A0A8T4C6V3_9ARCH|nr:DsbA family protein [Candidatus Diapherotrites archaeon]
MAPLHEHEEIPLRITAYFDFMCPWSYLGRVRLAHALQKIGVKNYRIEWVPFELYTHNKDHRVSREKIIGHERLNETYHELHSLGMRENILIYPPKYEASSKRALTGYLYALSHGCGEKYVDELFRIAFEHTMDISSFAVLRRAAHTLHLNTEEFLQFIQDEKNHDKIEEYTRVAKLNGVRGVPAYYINHFPITGALSVGEFEHIIHTAARKTTPAFVLPEKKTIHLPAARKKKKKNSTLKTIQKILHTRKPAPKTKHPKKGKKPAKRAKKR